MSESPAEPEPPSPGAEPAQASPGAEPAQASPGAEPAQPSPGAEPAQASAAQLVEELRKASVADLLVHTCSLLGSLAYGKLAPEVRDLEQARLAIDALKALVPVLPEDRSRELQQLVANLQLAYADAAAG